MGCVLASAGDTFRQDLVEMTLEITPERWRQVYRKWFKTSLIKLIKPWTSHNGGQPVRLHEIPSHLLVCDSVLRFAHEPLDTLDIHFLVYIDPNIHLSKDQCSSTDKEKVAMSKIPYKEAIGLLMWAAVATQPDIAFAVSLLSQFLKNPGEVHWKAVKRVIRYFKGTKNYRLTLGNNCNGLIGYADADWASQDHRHSISADIFQINGGNISWSCQKQDIVTFVI